MIAGNARGTSRRASGAAAIVVLALDGAASGAPSPARDPTAPHRIALGPPAGLWPMQRGDGARTGLSRAPFPLHPAVARRIPLYTDLAAPPVVDDRERLVLATKDGKLVEILPSGEVSLSLSLDAPAILGPVLESDGTRFVLTRDGTAVGISSDGGLAFETPLRMPRATAVAEPLATRDGAVVAALGARAMKIGADGEVRGEADLDETIVALTEDPATLYLATDTGRVFAWNPPASPHLVGNLGGKPTSEVVVLARGRLLAAVRGATLVELTVPDGARTALASLAPDVVIDTPARMPSGELRFTTRSGWLLGYAGNREVFRHSTTPPATLPVFTYPDAMLPVLVDPSGAVAFVSNAATVGVVSPSGEVNSTVLSDCGPPGALVPAGPRRLAAFCRSGFIAFVEEAKTPVPRPAVSGLGHGGP